MSFWKDRKSDGKSFQNLLDDPAYEIFKFTDFEGEPYFALEVESVAIKFIINKDSTSSEIDNFVGFLETLNCKN